MKGRWQKLKGLTYVQSYLTETEQAETLFCIDQAPWLHDLSRRVQHYGYKYDYRARSIDSSMRLGPLPSWASKLANKLVQSDHFRTTPDQAIVNEYLPSQGISPHVDCKPCFGDVIASVSLGSVAVMRLTSCDSPSRVDILLEPGSLLVLDGPARYKWKHSIPPRKVDRIASLVRSRTRRVSVTFRSVVD